MEHDAGGGIRHEDDGRGLGTIDILLAFIKLDFEIGVEVR